MNTKERITPILTLYRGKRKDTEEWIESCNINVQTDIKGNRHVYMGLNFHSDLNPQMVTIEWVEVITDTVGRWSKLYDTYNSREKLFEGDVVECETSRPDGQPSTTTMLISNVDCYTDMGYLDYCNGIKLIGNIYDEPKLATKHINTYPKVKCSPFDEESE